MDLTKLTLTQASDLLFDKKISSVELTQAYLARIHQINPELNAYLTVCDDVALAQAKKADEMIAQGQKKPLTGIPYACKDILVTKNIKTTAASIYLKDYIPPYDATVVQKLADEGAVLLGKTNLDVFAHGASTENSDFGPTKNPWDKTRVAGGSSGGSAAAVAADLCVFALGTDTGGSIRQPAAFCSVTSLKPTYGRVSRYGLIAMTCSTDCIGVLTKNILDNSIVMQALAGHDHHDATSLRLPVPEYSRDLGDDNSSPITVGIPKEFFPAELDPQVRDLINGAIKKFEKLGLKTKEISLPHTKYATPVYYVITPSELSTNLARLDGIRYGYSSPEAKTIYEVYTKSRAHGFSSEPKRRVMIGTFALSSGYYDAYYKKAQQVRTLIKQELDQAFKEVDLIFAPTSPHFPFKIGSQVNDPLKMYLEDVFLDSASMAGLPGLVVPCGFSKENLPTGLQIMGPQFSEDLLYKIGWLYQKNTKHHLTKPNV